MKNGAILRKAEENQRDAIKASCLIVYGIPYSLIRVKVCLDYGNPSFIKAK